MSKATSAVGTVTSPRDAIEAVGRVPMDRVVIDFGRPSRAGLEAGGLEATRAIKARSGTRTAVAGDSLKSTDAIDRLGAA